ncbi:MAG: sodium ion-translocating decarboxylase subunit beta [Clostridia bacterium]|nr:sodium ion-translocating decarboxylase subunit beta [Clostridia bacterium]
MIIEKIGQIFETTGIAAMFGSDDPLLPLKSLIMYVIVGALVYCAIVKKYEPLLLLPIAIGVLMANLPGANLFHMELFITEEKLDIAAVFRDGGLLDILYLGVKLGIYPSLIFLGIGAMTDFSPLIGNPKTIFIGGAAQFGVVAAFFGAYASGFFSLKEAAAIGIIGGADGPTAIHSAKILAPNLLSAIAIAAYLYMALIPMIQPPIIRLLTTKKERVIHMSAPRKVSRLEKILFPIVVATVVCLIVPEAAPLIGFLMFGNLLNVSGVTGRLSTTAQNGLMNTITVFLGVSVGATASASNFLNLKTLLIVALGIIAFAMSTAGGIIFAKFMCWITRGKINPLIGAAGVSAVPMAAKVVQTEGQRADPTNFLLMHAMGPNVAGVIGSAVAAGVFISFFA